MTTIQQIRDYVKMGCLAEDPTYREMCEKWAEEKGEEISSLLGSEDISTVLMKCRRAGYNMVMMELHSTFDDKMDNEDFRKAVALICAYRL